MPSSPIAIVGIGARFAQASNLQEFWERTVAAENTFSAIPEDRWTNEAFFDANPRARDKSYAPTGAWIDDIRAFPAIALQIPPRRAEVMDPQQRLSLETALEAIEDAGLQPQELPRNTGVYMGVTAVEYRTLSSGRLMAQMMASGQLGRAPSTPESQQALAAAVENMVAARPYSATGVLSNMIAAMVSQELSLRGPAFTTDAACASSMVAIDSAVKALRDGSIDVALAGGVYLCVTPEHHVAFSRIGAISKAGVCRPFDRRADGFVQGDGCGVLMLKRLEDAQRDGDRIYGVIHGIGSNNDGGGAGPMAPVKEGQVDVMRRAWADVSKDVDVNALGYIETHGTGTLVGDHTEFDGLMEALSANLTSARVGLGSSKANFGHTMSAAGVCGVIRAVLAMHHEVVPPMAGFEEPKPDLPLEGSPFFIPKEATPWTNKAKLACVSSFGFGGTNVHVVLGNLASVPQAAVAVEVAEEQAELVLMSSYDEVSLRALAAKTAKALARDSKATLAGTARSWAHKRRQAFRASIVARSKADLIAKLQALGEGGYPANVTLGEAPEKAPKVAFLYPGQGAQRVGMLESILKRFPVASKAMDEMDAVSAGILPQPISHYLYPARSTKGLSAEQALAELTETHITQPALFAVAHALTAILREANVVPAVVAGHSVGEFSAAAAAGLTSAEDGFRWCAARGAGMQAHIGEGGDKGAMAAFVADRTTAEQHLEAGAVVANVNHPRQVVISGATEAVRRSCERARKAGLEVTELRVSHAFHSPIFETMNLDGAVDAIAFNAASVPVASCIAENSYTDVASAAEVYKKHARSPVLWTGALERAVSEGTDLFLQVGAGGPLLSFVRGTLPGAKAIALASKDDQDEGVSLLEGLGQLFVAGVDVRLDSFIAPSVLASIPPITLPRERYWVVGEKPVDAVQLWTANNGKVKPGEVTVAAEVVAAKPVEAPKVEAKVEAKDELADLVYAAIAKASAYPRNALRPSMKLGDDLGFDSMMIADLAEELRKGIPGFAGIPQDLLISGPTIEDIIAFVKSPAATAQAAQVDDNAALSRFAPSWVSAPLATREIIAAPQAGAFVRVGEGTDNFAQVLLAKGWREVTAKDAADLVVVGELMAKAPSIQQALEGAAIADGVQAFISTLDQQARLNPRGCDVFVLTQGGLWDELAAGVARAAAREWSTRKVKVIHGGLSLGADLLWTELTTREQSVDVRYLNGERHVAATQPLVELEAWQPSFSDVVVITGGTRGIGRKLGEKLAQAGAEVVLIGRSVTGETAERLSIRAADVTDLASMKAALADLKPTVLIHSAGVLADGLLGSVDPSVGERARFVKVQGLLHAVAACGSSLERILALGSWAGRFGNRAQAHYAAANAEMSALVAALPAALPHLKLAISAEFGPWTDSEMARSIPEAMMAAMRAEGVDFVGDEAGLSALLEELNAPTSGVSIRGRQVPARLDVARRVVTLTVDSHPFLKDHAVPSDKGAIPVFPMASAADLIAETAQLQAPFELSDLTLYQGLAVQGPLLVECTIRGEQADIRQGTSRALSYQAKLSRHLSEVVLPEALTGGGTLPLSLERFYDGLTFHGPLLQGITAIDGVGETFVRGRVKTSAPASWEKAPLSTTWAIDPLAFDSAMQLAAYVAYVRFGRAGTPVGFKRWVQLREWPQGEVIAEASFANADSDRLEADLVFRTLEGEIIALAYGVAADMKKVDKVEIEPEFVPKAEWTDVSKWRVYKDLQLRLHGLNAMGLKNPYFDVHEGTARNTSRVEGREVINYSSYNYIGLSGDQRVLDEVFEAVQKYGTSVSASRIASGERPFHRDLEAGLAAAHGCEDAIVMAGGHATNVNTIGYLFGPQDLILHDELIHDSCLQGIKLSGAARRSFKHEDIADLERQLKSLRRHYEKVLILVEGVYSMDGDITNLPEYVRLKKQYHTMLMVDEAHSFGTIGRRGCGVGEYFGMDDPDSPERAKYGLVRNDVDLWMGTMSKSLSSMGGWISARKELIMVLRYNTPGFVFAAGIPPALGQAALSSLRYMLKEPERVAKLQYNSKRFYELLKERGIDTGPSLGESPVIPVITGDSMIALKLSERLLYLGVTADSQARGETGPGINAKPIIFPAVANDSARLRFFMTSLHTEEQLIYTADAIKRTLDQLREEAAAAAAAIAAKKKQ